MCLGTEQGLFFLVKGTWYARRRGWSLEFFFFPVKIKTRYNPCKSTLGLSDQEVASVLLKEGREFLKLFSESALSSDWVHVWLAVHGELEYQFLSFLLFVRLPGLLLLLCLLDKSLFCHSVCSWWKYPFT